MKTGQKSLTMRNTLVLSLVACFVLVLFVGGVSAVGTYPAVDPLDSTSRILSPAILGDAHYNCAQRVKEI